MKRRHGIEDWVDLVFHQKAISVTLKIKRSKLGKYGGMVEKFLDKNQDLIDKFRKGEISFLRFEKKLLEDLENK